MNTVTVNLTTAINKAIANPNDLTWAKSSDNEHVQYAYWEAVYRFAQNPETTLSQHFIDVCNELINNVRKGR